MLSPDMISCIWNTWFFCLPFGNLSNPLTLTWLSLTDDISHQSFELGVENHKCKTIFWQETFALLVHFLPMCSNIYLFVFAFMKVLLPYPQNRKVHLCGLILTRGVSGIVGSANSQQAAEIGIVKVQNHFNPSQSAYLRWQMNWPKKEGYLHYCLSQLSSRHSTVSNFKLQHHWQLFLGGALSKKNWVASIFWCYVH